MEHDAAALEQCYRATSFQQLLPFLSKFYAVTPRTIFESDCELSPPPSPAGSPPPDRDEVQPTTPGLSSPPRKRRKDPGARLERQDGRTSGRRKAATSNGEETERESYQRTWTPEDDDRLHYLVSTESRRALDWGEVAQHFTGRSEDDVKERWMSYEQGTINCCTTHPQLKH